MCAVSSDELLQEVQEEMEVEVLQAEEVLLLLLLV